MQLQAYAVAVDERALGAARPESLVVTFAYFGDGLEERSQTVDDRWLAAARNRITGIIDGIKGEGFEPTPSAACLHCDFVRFCDAGRAWLAGNP